MAKILIEEKNEELTSNVEGSAKDILVLYAKLTHDLSKYIPKEVIESAMHVGVTIREDEEND